MPGLFTSLLTAAGTLQVFDRALGVIQNNVGNSMTEGYASQRMSPVALPFEPGSGLSGGISAGEIESSRSQYAEQSVWRAQQFWGRFRQTAAELARLEPLFDVTGTSGIPGALSRLFQSFSSWSVTPNDTVARQVVIDGAGEVAREFSSTAAGLKNGLTALQQPIRLVTQRINDLAGVVRGLNDEFRRDFHSRGDPNLDAGMQAALEELAEYVDFTAVRQEDGSYTVLLGGEAPLVIGGKQYAVQADLSAGSAVIRDSEGKDVTSRVHQGRLGALLEATNSTIPSYLADLNRLAAAFADRVNGTLAAGLDMNGNPGAPLFAYHPAAGAALTMRTTSIAPSELAGALAGAPGGNANALDLADLADATAIDGLSLIAFYGGLAARAGQALSSARQNEQTHEDMLIQARALRAEESGVSLDEEAARLIEFQRAYQASARMVTVLNDLLETTINLVR